VRFHAANNRKGAETMRHKTRPVNHSKADLIEVPLPKETSQRLQAAYDDFCQSVVSGGGTAPDFPNFVAICLKRYLDHKEVEY
jgi:hypothetical protein